MFCRVFDIIKKRVVDPPTHLLLSVDASERSSNVEDSRLESSEGRTPITVVSGQDAHQFDRPC